MQKTTRVAKETAWMLWGVAVMVFVYDGLYIFAATLLG